MGHQEDENRRRSRRANIKKITLEVVRAAGVLSIAIATPNVLGAISKLGVAPRARREESIKNARSTLIKQGLLRCESGSLIITKKGENALRHMMLSEPLPRSKRWDGKWRVLLFDIPDRRRGLRDTVRNLLQRDGFVKLQNSAWVFPYPCEEFVALLKSELKVGRELQYLIVDSIENDTDLREAFALK